MSGNFFSQSFYGDCKATNKSRQCHNCQCQGTPSVVCPLIMSNGCGDITSHIKCGNNYARNCFFRCVPFCWRSNLPCGIIINRNQIPDLVNFTLEIVLQCLIRNTSKLKVVVGQIRHQFILPVSNVRVLLLQYWLKLRTDE